MAMLKFAFPRSRALCTASERQARARAQRSNVGACMGAADRYLALRARTRHVRRPRRPAGAHSRARLQM
eukprot:7426658-Pyramimonas_sp.AAC.1